MSPEPGRFHAAAHHYLHGRPAYALALIRRVAQVCGLDSSHGVLDLGCGPGQLALAFAPFAGRILGIDPEPEMLSIARQEAARAGLAIAFQEGSSRDLGADLGSFRLVVIGRAFHWMDRLHTLLDLDRMIEPGGAVVLFGHDHPRVPDNRWCAAFDDLIDRHTQADTARKARRGPDWPSHEAVLLDSPFARLERLAVIERRLTSVEHLVERALSFSSVWHAPTGSDPEALAAEVRRTVEAFARDGLVGEVVESEALIARRAGA